MLQLNFVNWNFTRHIKSFKNADVIVLSVSKSGRTWLRVLLDRYFEEFTVNNNTEEIRKTRFFYTHELFEHRNNANIYEKIRGRYIMPDSLAFNKKIIFLYRDPRDVVVSYFHQKTKRSAKRVEMDISKFIRHPVYGIKSIIYVMNTWRHRFKNYQNCFPISYEDLKRDTDKTLSQVIQFIDSQQVCLKSAKKAIDYASFENMQKRETACLSSHGELLPGNPSNPESYKARKGKVGSYTEELNNTDQMYVNESLKHLDPFFGYTH